MSRWNQPIDLSYILNLIVVAPVALGLLALGSLPIVLMVLGCIWLYRHM